MEKKHVRLGDMLVGAGLIDAAQVDSALAAQKETGRRLGEELVAQGFLSEVQMTQVLSKQLSVPWVSLYHVEFSRELLSLLPPELAASRGVIPVYVRRERKDGDILFVAMDDPTSEETLARITDACGLPARPMVAPPTEIKNAINVYYFGRPPKVPKPPPRAPTGTEQPRATGVSRADGKGGEVPAPPAAAASQPPPTPNEARATKPPRMITLTMLDGTTVNLPAPGQDRSEAPPEHALTATDLVAALLARAEGKDVRDVWAEPGWERLFATLLGLLIRKGLIADWEFVDELKKRRG